MTEPNRLADLTKQLTEAAMQVAASATRYRHEYETVLALLPQPGETLADLLNELAAAQDARDTFHRHYEVVNPDVSGYERYADPKQFEKDWTACLARYDRAVARMVAYARALREVASAPAPEQG